MRTGILTGVVVLAAAVAPATADAAPRCDFSGGLLEVTLGTDDDVRLERIGDQIVVFGNGVATSCLGADPTVTNTNAVTIHNAPGDANSRVVLYDVERFAPGLSPEAGHDEIELFVNLNDGPGSRLAIITDELQGGHVVFGAGGINPNAFDTEVQPDDDIDVSGVRQLSVVGGTGPDVLSAQGGRGTGAPLNAQIELDGNEGDDVLHGGGGADWLLGGTGEDELAGFGGDDYVEGGPGENVLLSGGDGADDLSPGSAADPVDGGPGDDALHYASVGRAVAVSLDGTAVETLNGTQYDDVLLGDDGPNTIDGFAGNDQIAGAGGADTIDGGFGDDVLHVRDGAIDTAGCGPDVDAITADAQGVDRITDCETVLFPPPPPPPDPPGGGPGGDPGAPAPPPSGGGSGGPPPPAGGSSGLSPRPATFGPRTRVALALARKRAPVRRAVLVVVRNANAFAISGVLAGRAGRRRLAQRSFAVAANSSATVRVPLPRTLQRAGRRALRITATVRDPAGNARSVRATLRGLAVGREPLVRPPRA